MQLRRITNKKEIREHCHSGQKLTTRKEGAVSSTKQSNKKSASDRHAPWLPGIVENAGEEFNDHPDN